VGPSVGREWHSLNLERPLRLPGQPRRVFQEVIRQGPGVGREFALGPAELDPPQGGAAAVELLVEVALDCALAEVGQAGDPGVRQAAALQPQNLHLLLHAREGVVEALAIEGGHVLVGEGEFPRGEPRFRSGEARGSVWPSARPVNIRLYAN
jgi:hypothetical protein